MLQTMKKYSGGQGLGSFFARQQTGYGWQAERRIPNPEKSSKTHYLLGFVVFCYVQIFAVM